MQDFNKNSEEIIQRIGEKRFQHTLRVKDTAVELAKIFGEDIEKASVAGFYHDCAKIRDEEILLEECKKYNIEISEEMQKSPQILHGLLGAEIARVKYDVDDEDVLNAIRYHTTGRENMSKLEKIVFLADFTEPMRNFPGVEKIREVSKIDLDTAMYLGLNNTLKHLLDKNEIVYSLSMRARNYYLELANEEIF